MRYYRITTASDELTGITRYRPTRDPNPRRGTGTTANVELVRTGFHKSVTVDVHVCPNCAWRITRPNFAGRVREITWADARDREIAHR